MSAAPKPMKQVGSVPRSRGHIVVLVGAMLLGLSPLISAEPLAPALSGKRISDAALARQRGGADTGSGTVSANSAVNVTTGSNLITGAALSGATGVPVVIQNSGNNVLIQSSVIVNLQLK